MRMVGFVVLFFLSAAVFAAEPAWHSAGVSEEDRQAQPEYSLKLVFFEKGGPYIANVEVEIFDQAGQSLLQVVSEGPWLFVDLSPGHYSVRAKRENGDEQSVRLQIEEQQKMVALAF